MCRCRKHKQTCKDRVTAISIREVDNIVVIRTDKSFIKSTISIKENQLLFTIENSFIENASKDKIGGLGIDNVQKRLALFYPNKHQLNITEDAIFFMVELKIDIAT